MMRKRFASVAVGVLAGLALSGIALVAPASAGAACDEAQEATFNEFIEFGDVFPAFGFESDPSEQDCTKICNRAAKGCKQTSSDFGRAASHSLKTEATAARILCKTAARRADCKRALKDLARLSRSQLKDDIKALKVACTDSRLEATCGTVCNTGAPLPATCEEIFQ